MCKLQIFVITDICKSIFVTFGRTRTWTAMPTRSSSRPARRWPSTTFRPTPTSSTSWRGSSAASSSSSSSSYAGLLKRPLHFSLGVVPVNSFCLARWPEAGAALLRQKKSRQKVWLQSKVRKSSLQRFSPPPLSLIGHVLLLTLKQKL
jgi:hypothetical protein